MLGRVAFGVWRALRRWFDLFVVQRLLAAGIMVLGGMVNETITVVSSMLLQNDALAVELKKTSQAFVMLAEVASEFLTGRVALTLVLLYVLYRMYLFFFTPFRRILMNHEVGYLPERNQSTMERSMDVRRRRRTGDLPPVYPNGWFGIAQSHEVPVGTSKQVTALGLELAVFRTEDGEVAILDAYCPHLGANLAAGGIVKGNTISCPFHGWQFNKEGVCVKIPYCDHVPAGAAVKKYTCLENNGHILLWFDAEGRDPYWYPPKFEGINNGSWTFRGESQHHINAHIQETPENGADVPHLQYLHGPLIATGTDLRKTERMQFIRHIWDADWKAGEGENKYFSFLDLTHVMHVFGYALKFTELNVHVTQAGPGLVYLEASTPFGRAAFVHSLCPVEPLLQRANFSIYAERTVPTFVAKMMLASETIQFERDLMVWNNKTYRGNPVLCKGDYLIKKHRMWYNQFYSEHSPTYAEATRNNTDW
eukprot:m.269667 g.269667  ORF g.269667 m.269667 type:complete len:479 (+) comp54748_c0_seq1:1082-2518(+)